MRPRQDINTTQLQLRWSPNAFKGYGAALVIFVLVAFVTKCTKVEPPGAYRIPGTTTVDLVFGAGNATGPSGGNLTAEGKAKRGPEGNLLEDASNAKSSKVARQTSDPTQSALHVPVPDVGNKGTHNDASASDVNRGTKDGAEDGPGLGWAGGGSGKGLGYGLEWGGGGNRIVLNKVLPKFPAGTLNTQVKLKFRVRPDGTVSWVIPVRRGGNPEVDQAAIQAMYRWRFNPLTDDTEMEGTISFVFKNS